jgi:hypothetical protein
MFSRRTYIVGLLGSLAVGTLIYASLIYPSRATPSPSVPDAAPETSFPSPSVPAPRGNLTAVDELFQRQSATLDEAVARYTLRNGRPPPPGYDRWFQFAQAGQCLTDDYDQLYDDFAPFHQLARLDRGYFKRMVERGIKIVRAAVVQFQFR